MSGSDASAPSRWTEREAWRLSRPDDWRGHWAPQIGFSFFAIGVVIAAAELPYQLGLALGGGADAAGGALALASAVVAAGLSLAAYIGVMWWLEGRRDRAELAADRAVPETITGLVIAVLLFCAVVGVIALLGGYELSGLGAADDLLRGLAAGVVAGVSEELVFRGIALRRLAGVMPPIGALALTAVLFGLLHLGNPEATMWGATAIAIEAGVLLGLAFLVTRRLWLAIGIHIGWNATQQGVFGAAVSGTEVEPGLVQGSFDQSPALLTGGAFGPEASVPAVVLCLVVAGGLVLFARRLEPVG